MLTALALLVVALPFLLLVAGLQLSAWRRRTRHAAATRQIAVTDAIHAALGAVVAPVVRRRPWGRWQLLIPVPFDRPDTVRQVVEIAYGAFDAPERMNPGQFELVLSPQEKPVPYRDRAVVAARSSRGESVSWT